MRPTRTSGPRRATTSSRRRPTRWRSTSPDRQQEQAQLRRPQGQDRCERPHGKFDVWKKKIQTDKTTVTNIAGNKKWTNPQKGFLNLNKELVKAMTSSAGGGLTWLGDDTIAGRDIMHFDTRGVGPIKGIRNS